MADVADFGAKRLSIRCTITSELEVAIDAQPKGKVVGQIMPLLAVVQQIKDSVANRSHVQCLPSPSRFGWWYVSFKQLPLGSNQIATVC